MRQAIIRAVWICISGFTDALRKQFASTTRAVVKGKHVIDEICMDRPCPALSLTFKECIENAGDLFTFYADEIERYHPKFGIMTPGILPVSGNTPFGLQNVTCAWAIDSTGVDSRSWFTPVK